MTNKEKFSALVSKEKVNTLERNKERIKSRAMLRESQQIAMKILTKLDELGMSQKDLSKALEVSPQQVNKIVSGKENLTIDTQIKIQTVLDIPILASFYENKMNYMEEMVLKIEKRFEKIVAKANQTAINYQEAKTIKMQPQCYSNEPYQLVG